MINRVDFIEVKPPLGLPSKFVQYDLSHIKQKKMINQRKAVELCKKV